MRLPELRSPLARAVVPVAAGLGVLALIALATLGAAVYVAGNEDPSERLIPTEIGLGDLEDIATRIADEGPIVLAGLGAARDRALVLDHQADGVVEGWRLYLAHPADRPPTCDITQNQGTATFVDCEDRTLGIEDLAAPPAGVHPVVDVDDRTLSIDLRGFSSTPATTGSS